MHLSRLQTIPLFASVSLRPGDGKRSKDLDGDGTEHDSITLFDSAGNDSHSLSIEPSHDNNRNSLQSASP
jgi:hypothetical protein